MSTFLLLFGIEMSNIMIKIKDKNMQDQTKLSES